jgi:hypothetical protein
MCQNSLEKDEKTRLIFSKKAIKFKRKSPIFFDACTPITTDIKNMCVVFQILQSFSENINFKIIETGKKSLYHSFPEIPILFDQLSRITLLQLVRSNSR